MGSQPMDGGTMGGLRRNLGKRAPSPPQERFCPHTQGLFRGHRGSVGPQGDPTARPSTALGGRDLGPHSSCPQGGPAEPLTRRTWARGDGSAPPSSASAPSPGCSSASLPGTDPLPSAPHSWGCPPWLPPSGLTPSRSHWKSRTLVPGGFLSCTLTASTALSSPVQHSCTFPSGKASSSSWKGENGALSPPTRMAGKGLKGCEWDCRDRARGDGV